ncbi:MAG: YdeI/OmpD-associated family protein [Nocardioidaceae bacterium]|nr:YdeI/OmpD-associated family protein [Nocardioidaceae bacterium]
MLATPRRKGSRWSRSNKLRIEKLTAQQALARAGLAVIERGRQDGTWSAHGVENLVEPDDLAAALDAHSESQRHWNAFPRSAKRGIL